MRNRREIYDADVYYGFFIELESLIPFMEEDWLKEYNKMLEKETPDERFRLVDDYFSGQTPIEKNGVKFDTQLLPIDMYSFYDIDDDKTDIFVVGIHQKHMEYPCVLDLQIPFRQKEQIKLKNNEEFKKIAKLFEGKSLQNPQVIVLYKE